MPLIRRGGLIGAKSRFYEHSPGGIQISSMPVGVVMVFSWAMMVGAVGKQSTAMTATILAWFMASFSCLFHRHHAGLAFGIQHFSRLLICASLRPL